MTEIPLNAIVRCTDARCGKTTNVIVNPVSLQVTHIVLRDENLGLYPTRLVPVGMVASATSKQITLSCSRDDVVAMPPFLVDNFVRDTPPGETDDSGDAYTSQYVLNDTGHIVHYENMPKGGVGIHSGMEIEASDGKIGKIGELVLDPKTGAITHIQMCEGHLWGKKDVAIPIADIDFSDGQTINLKLTKEAVKSLPAVKVKRK